MTMTKVFIGGSRRISKLDDSVKHRIDNIIAKNFKVIIGDASGADLAVQTYLSTRNYRNVEIFCMEGRSRYNIGGWPTRNIPAIHTKRKDFSYYSMKDHIMAQEADHSFMLWDGCSRGTLRNIAHLSSIGAPVLLYMSQDRSFHTLRGRKDFAKMLDQYKLSDLQNMIEFSDT